MIAKDKRYRELVDRHMQLRQLYSVMLELNLHITKAVSSETAKYYDQVLFNLGYSPDFFKSSLKSMRQVFYIELNGFIDAFWCDEEQKLKCRKNDTGSLYKYLYDGTRQKRKKLHSRDLKNLLEKWNPY